MRDSKMDATGDSPFKFPWILNKSIKEKKLGFLTDISFIYLATNVFIF